MSEDTFVSAADDKEPKMNLLEAYEKQKQFKEEVDTGIVRFNIKPKRVSYQKVFTNLVGSRNSKETSVH